MSKKGKTDKTSMQISPRLLIRALLRSIPVIPGPELYDILDELRKSRTSIDEKVTKATQSLHETSNLIQDLEQDLKERSKKLEYLRDQVKRYSELATIEGDKAKPLLKEIQTVINRGKGIERVISLVINLVAGILIFIFGVLVGPKITSWFYKSENPTQLIQQETRNIENSIKDSNINDTQKQ